MTQYKSSTQAFDSHPNVNADEIDKFEAMAADWWRPDGPCKPLHDLNPLRLNFIQANACLKNKRLLDVGCGGGIFSESLSKHVGQVVGIDCAGALIDVAKAHASNLANPPYYQCIDVEAFALQQPESFDVITCMEMLEHVPDPAAILKACATLLKSNGHLFCSTLNRTPKAFLQAIIGAEYLLKILPMGTHDYQYFIRPSELADLARLEGLRVRQLKGIGYKLLSQSYHLCDDLSVNYLIHLVKE